MVGDPQLELRVSRLENDSISIYEIITEIRSTLHEHSRRFESVDQRFDSVDQRFDSVDRRFDAVDRRFDSVDRRFDAVEATLTEIVRRLPDPA